LSYFFPQRQLLDLVARTGRSRLCNHMDTC
jgi:hypothetical protein